MPTITERNVDYMRKAKKLAAVLACVLMATSASGCTNTKYAVKADGEEIKAGIYIGYLQDVLIDQINELYYDGVTEDYFSQQVEGKSLAEYVKEKALQSTKENYAIKKQFESEGLSFTDEEIKLLNTNFNDAWDNSGELFEEIGVGKESYKEIYRDYLRRSKLFTHYYGEGGEKAPTDDEMVKYIDDNYMRYKIMTFYKSSSEDEATADEANAKALESRDKYYEIGKDYSFEEFDQLIDQRTADEAAEAAEAEEAAEGTEDEAESSVDETESSAEETESTEEVSSEEESEEEEVSAEISRAEAGETLTEEELEEITAEAADEGDEEAEAAESAEDESTADAGSESADETADSTEDSTEETAETDDETTESGDEDEELADPYANDVMLNYGALTDEELASTSGELYKKIREESEGKVFTFESDYGYYIVIKGDVTARSADYLEENRSTVLSEMKEDEFTELINSWVEAIDFTVNDKAINRYSPETIYKKITDYYDSKNTANTAAS